MNTWTFNRSISAFALCCGVAGCGDGLPQFSFLGGSPENPRVDVSRDTAELLDGRLILSPPQGYCVDGSSVAPDFAIVARCDSLGRRGKAPSVPLGMMVIAAQSSEAEANLAEDLAALLPEGSDILERSDTANLSLVQLSGPVPDESDAIHWRGLAALGGALLSISAFAPKDGPFSSEAGAVAVRTLVAQTARASNIEPDPEADDATDPNPPARRGLGSLIGGLFN